MSQNRDSQSTPPRFLDVAKEVCEDAKFDISVSTARAAELQQQMEKEYSDGVTELGLHPYAAARRALELFDPPSAVKQCKKPVVERLLFSDKYRPMRWFLITVAVLTGMIAYFRSDGFKNGREVGWVQRVIDLVRWVIGCIGGMCFLTEISVLLGLRQKSRALYSRGSELLLCRLGGRGGQIAVPIGLALLFIALVVRHGGLPPASDADRSMAAKSPSPASNSITEHRLSEGVRGVAEEESRTVKPAGSEPKGSTGAGSSVSSTVAGATVSTAKLDVNEASRTVTSSAEEKSGAVELDGTKPAVAIADAPPSDGLVASWLEPPVPEAKEEPPSFPDLGAMRGGAGVEPARSEIAGGIIAGSSPSSIDAGANASIAESKVNEASGGSAPFAKEKSGAVELDGSKIAGGIADSPGSAGLMVPKLQPPVPKAGQTRPAPPGDLMVIVGP